MTFLSRLELRPGDLRVTRDLADVGQLHRTIMRAFPEVDSRTPRRDLRVLFRIEGRGSRRLVIVQSAVEPDWSRLERGYLSAADVKDISGLVSAVEADRELRFLLVANPSRKSVRVKPGIAPPRNSRRHALVTDDERHRWLVARGERDGFSLIGGGPHDGVRIDPVVVLSPPGPRRRAGITVRPVRYEGRLRVEDAERLREALLSGIGPAKAYGCGLLSLAAG